MITFRVPSGIGDFSAMYAKLCNIKRDMAILPAAYGGGPARLMPFLDLLPNINHEASHYGDFNNNLAVVCTIPPGTDLNSLPDNDYYLSINDWLESGGPVEKWIPGITDYHYAMNISDELKLETKQFLDSIPIIHGPLIGVYTTSYSNSRHWGFWGYNEWYNFLKEVRGMLKDPVFIFIGAEYDMGLSDALYKMMLDTNLDLNQAYFRAYFTIGRFHIGSTIELIRQLDYFFVFPSGLGFLADVVRTPHTMWFPPNLNRMRYTFTDPATKGRSIHDLFMDPMEAAESFLNNGYNFVEAKDAGTSQAL